MRVVQHSSLDCPVNNLHIDFKAMIFPLFSLLCVQHVLTNQFRHSHTVLQHFGHQILYPTLSKTDRYKFYIRVLPYAILTAYVIKLLVTTAHLVTQRQSFYDVYCIQRHWFFAHCFLRHCLTAQGICKTSSRPPTCPYTLYVCPSVSLFVRPSVRSSYVLCIIQHNFKCTRL